MEGRGVLPAFFINLDRHPERRAHIERQLTDAGISAERVSGIDGRDLPPELAAYFNLKNSSRRALTPGQTGCHASHLKVMQIILERDLDAALVLEDDAIIETSLRDTIKETLERLPAGWDIVRLCRPAKRAVRILKPLSFGRSVVRFSRVPIGRAGYLVSKCGARKLLTPRVMKCPGDVEIAHPWLLNLDVYGVEPPPISQERRALPSTIGDWRGGWNRIQRSLPDLSRVVFNLRKLGPYWWLRCFAENMKTGVLRRFELTPSH